MTRILLDENVPRKLKRAFASDYDVTTVQEHGWAGALNGELLQRADAEFEAFVTLDRGIEYQQDLTGLSIRIVIVRAFSNKLSGLITTRAVRPGGARALAPGRLDPRGGLARCCEPA